MYVFNIVYFFNGQSRVTAVGRILCLASWKTQRAGPAVYSSNFSNMLSGAGAEEKHFTHTASVGLRTLLVLSQVSCLPSLAYTHTTPYSSSRATLQ